MITIKADPKVKKFQEFHVGDRVKYVSGRHGDDRKCDPLWGGKAGKVKGSITKIFEAGKYGKITGKYILVKWDNFGYLNDYTVDDLEFASEPLPFNLDDLWKEFDDV